MWLNVFTKIISSTILDSYSKIKMMDIHNAKKYSLRDNVPCKNIPMVYKT